MTPEKKLSVGESQVVEAAMPAPSRSLTDILKENRLVSYWQDEWKPLALIAAVFLVCYYIPVGNVRFDNAVMEALYLVKWYAQEHVLLCLVPAFFIAGVSAVFVSQESVMKYLGPTASKWFAYPVASVSGTVLAVCSCTVLPLFAGIWQRGAGLGPALSLPSMLVINSIMGFKRMVVFIVLVCVLSTIAGMLFGSFVA